MSARFGRLGFAVALAPWALAATPACPERAGEPTPATVAALPLEAAAGRGARVPFVEYEAENARTNGVPVGPDRTFTTLAAEASGRRAVRLQGRGRFVEFTLGRPANALVVRSAIPDAERGGGLDATLGVYVDGARIGSLPVTSKYAWYYGRYPFTNTPSAGGAHHFFDESRLILDRTLPTGTRVRLMVGPEDDAPWYVIDLADFELVGPPKPPPLRALSILEFGADPTGVRSSAEAIRRALSAGRRQGRPVWIPPGRFRVERRLVVDQVHLAGAGAWRSVLFGAGVGLDGRKAPRASRAVVLTDFALMGEVAERVDSAPLAGVGGAMGDGSVIEGLWIQHTKVGLWFDGPMDGIAVRGLRILDQAADGLNFHRGVSHAVVENTFVRNSGDDGLAAWSDGDANHDIVFRDNTVIAPTLANGIALYGGRDLLLDGNLVADTVTQGGGLHLGARFGATPFEGWIRLVGNTVVRGGVLDPNWRFGVGALWFYALDRPMHADFDVSDTALLDSTYEAIQFIGKAITGVRVRGARLVGAGSYAVQLQAPGAATFTGVTATGLGREGVYDCGSGFILTRKGGGGWDGHACEAIVRP